MPVASRWHPVCELGSRRSRREKDILILVCVMGGWLIASGCASPMVNLHSTRLHAGGYGQVLVQIRPIQNHGQLKGPPESGTCANPETTDPNLCSNEYDSIAGGYLLRLGRGWVKDSTGLELGVQVGVYEHFHWVFQKGSSVKYYPSAQADYGEGANIFYFNPYVKLGLRQNSRLKVALTAEWIGASVMISYDHGAFHPYITAKLALAKYEAPHFEWVDTPPWGLLYRTRDFRDRLSLVPLAGCEISLSRGRNVSLGLEAGLIPNYFRSDNLYVIGFSITSSKTKRPVSKSEH